MIELLNKHHRRDGFNCGNDLLNDYFKQQAGQDVKRKLAACFVLVNNNTKAVQGYYTLSNYSIPLGDFSTEIQKKLPRSYTAVPTTLLGRLAVDVHYKGSGLGKILLIDALKRSFENSIQLGSFAVVVDPIDENAERFYSKYDFIKLPDSGKMFIAMKTLEQLFK